MKWKKNSALIFSWGSTNINVQVSNSYKRNLKVIKCKLTLHSLVCIDRWMLIKAITLFRLRAVGDFLFAFCSLVNIDEAPVCHFKTKYWHTSDFFPTVLAHFKTWTVFKWIISKLAVFTYFVCIWSFGCARSSKCTLLISFRARRTGTHTHTHFSLENSIPCVDCTFNVLLSNMSSNLATVKMAFYNNRQPTNDFHFDASLVKC